MSKISEARETARKITKVFLTFGIQLEFESFKSVKYPLCYEFLNLEPFFWLTQYGKHCHLQCICYLPASGREHCAFLKVKVQFL